MGKLLKTQHFFFAALILTFFLSEPETYAQERCSTTEAEKIRREKYKFLPSEKDFENWLEEKTKESNKKTSTFRTHESEEPVKIAVVVHVIYREGEAYGQGANISDEQIFSQIEVLNEDYKRKNADTINTQTEFLGVVSKMNIEFVLARQTGDGNPTTGITRNKGPKNEYNPLSMADRELLSSISDWDPNVYLNIWVTNMSGSNIGLAQFPDYSFPGLDGEANRDNAATDGLIIDYKAFGSAAKVSGLDLMPKYNLGRTATHELGHFFGLKHVWGDNTSNCSVDDYVEDTPASIKTYSGETDPLNHESCNTNDMFENFLYYTNDKGMNSFTAEQVGRMNTIIENAPRRGSLYNSVGTEYPQNLYLDLALTDIPSPGKVVCDNMFDLVIEVKNNGTIPVTDFDVWYDLNGIEQTFSYSGDTIFTGQTVQIPIDGFPIQKGNYKLNVTLTNIPEDINAGNNKKINSFVVDDQRDFPPLREQFDVTALDATNWSSINEDDKIGWEIRNAPLVSTQNNAAFINLYNYAERQQQDWLISPSLDFSGAYAASVTFKASYAKNEFFNDQLRIVASKNCGADFDYIPEVYQSNDLENESSMDFWEPAGQNDWRTYTVDLGKYAGEPSVRLAFVSVNDYGNNLYIDDIEFFVTAEDDLVKTAQNSFTLYPNPSFDGSFQLAFNTLDKQKIVISIYDETGRVITANEYQNTLNQTYYYDLSGFSSGVYIVRAQGEDFARTKKLVISK